MEEKSLTTKDKLCSADRRFYLHLGAILLIGIFFRFIPPIADMTAMGMAVLGVFLSTIYGWLFLGNMGLSSFLGIVLMGTTGFWKSPSASISAAFGSTYVVMLVMCFAVVALLEHSGGLEIIVKAILRINVLRRSSGLLLAALMFLSFLIGSFGLFGYFFLMWALWAKLSDEMGGSLEFKQLGIGGLLISFTIDSLAWPFCSGYITVTGVFTGASGLPGAPFLNYTLWMWLMFILISGLYLLTGRFIFRIPFPDASGLTVEPARQVSRYQRFTIIGLFTYMLLMMYSSISSDPVAQYLKGWGIIGLGAALLLIACMLRPSGALEKPDMYLNKYIPWSLLMNIGMIALLSSCLSSEELGIIASVNSSLSFLAELPLFLFVLILSAIPLVLTQFLNNVALGAVFIPVTYALSVKAGANLYAMNYAMYLMTSMAVATPAGCATATLFFSNEHMTKRAAWKFALPIVIITWFVTVFIGVFLLGDVFFPASLIPG